MSCAMEENLTAYLDGELDLAGRQAMELHLSRCADCSTTLALLRRTVSELTTLPEVEPSTEARRRFFQRFDALADPWRVRWAALLKPAVWVPLCGAAAAGVVALTLVAHHPSRELQPPQVAQLELARNLELAQNFEVLGLDSPDDVEVVAHLKELEGRP